MKSRSKVQKQADENKPDTKNIRNSSYLYKTIEKLMYSDTSVVAWSRGLGAMGRCWPRHKRSGRRLTFCSVTQSCPTF